MANDLFLEPYLLEYRSSVLDFGENFGNFKIL